MLPNRAGELQSSYRNNSSYAAKGASEGAAVGAASCAVGGLVSALLFGGNAIDHAARSAVYCGAAGAVAGGISGSQMDKQVKQRQDDELARLRQQVGEEAFQGLKALAVCDFDVSLRHANEAQRSDNPNYSLSGLWLEVLTYADQRNESRARSLLPGVVEKDWNIASEAQAEATMRKAMNDLTRIREQYGLVEICS